MKLLIHRQAKVKSFTATSNEIRLSFVTKGLFQAWAIYEELLSHKDGFVCSTEFIKNRLGFSDKVWEKHAKTLELMGHLERYKKPNTNEWTFVFQEKAIEITANRKEFKTDFAEKKEIARKKTVRLKELGVPPQKKNSLFSEEDWIELNKSKQLRA